MPIVALTTDPSIAYPLLLATTLNSVAAGLLSAPEAEALIRRDGRPHHVLDAEGQWGLDEGVSVRRILARIDGTSTPWALLLPTPGHLAGLRGPASVNLAAIEHGAVVVRHDGGPAFLCDQVGHGVQWTMLQAERPLLPDDPRTAGRSLLSAMNLAAEQLRGGELASRRPTLQSPQLGKAYPASSQSLLDRAWLVLAAADADVELSGSATTSHRALQLERGLRPLARAARDAISAAVSWPSHSLVT